MREARTDQFAGILLAAGKGARFDPSGAQNKLMQSIENGDAVAVAAAKNMLAVLPMVQAVVRPGADALAAQLRMVGCTVTECPTAEAGIGASLVFALTQVRHADGWVIALADMPYVRPATVAALVHAIADGADIAVPTCGGRRGNPVAFSRLHLPRLLQLSGDQGARSLLRTFAVVETAVDDPGIHRDIDTIDDLG